MTKLLKILAITLFLSVSSQAAMQKSGKINIDPKPIEDILNKYYDICETAKDDRNTRYDQKSLNALKPLKVVQDDLSASLSLSACKDRILKAKRIIKKGYEGADLTRKLKVLNLTYDQGTITAFYAYFAYQHPGYKHPQGVRIPKSYFQNHFQAIKKADGSVGYLMQ